MDKALIKYNKQLIFNHKFACNKDGYKNGTPCKYERKVIFHTKNERKCEQKLYDCIFARFMVE